MPDTVPALISSKQLNTQPDGTFTVTLANPLSASYIGIGDKGRTLIGPSGADGVLSVQDADGEPQVRAKGTAGAFEKCKKSNGLLVFTGFGQKCYAIPFVEQ